MGFTELYRGYINESDDWRLLFGVGSIYLGLSDAPALGAVAVSG